MVEEIKLAGCVKCRILYRDRTGEDKCEKCGSELIDVDPAELANPDGPPCPECGYGMWEVEDCWAWHGGGCGSDSDPWVHCIGCDMRVKWDCEVCGHVVW